jgi:hypothetical protein
MSAFRGFAKHLVRVIVLSAGYNPRVYAYIAQFDDFLPDAQGTLRKKVILKVSDLRSALIQGKILAKKGVWVSEFRIESGLNCGGHAFATDGILLGPILQEFHDKREAMAGELFELCNKTLADEGKNQLAGPPSIRITVQGGIGTVEEDSFLRTYYGMDGTGWGSPFLLVPEATNVDEHTLQQLTHATPDDYYMSWASPLDRFHNFRPSTSGCKTRMAKVDRKSVLQGFLSTDTSSRQRADFNGNTRTHRAAAGEGLEQAAYIGYADR